MSILPVAVAMVAGLLLAGCDGSDPTAVQVAPSSPATPAIAPALKSPVDPAVPSPGWVNGVIRARRGAYIMGWRTDGSGALWHLDAHGRLAARSAPPGMPGNPGTTSADRVLNLELDGPRLGLALIGRTGDEGQPGAEAVYLTNDGARHWRRVRLPSRQQPLRMAVGGGAAFVLTGVCAPHRFTCRRVTLWSVDDTTGTARRADRFTVRPGDVAQTSLAVWAGSLWLQLGLGGPHPLALRSTDHGRSWTRTDTGPCLSQELVPTSTAVVWSTCTTGLLEQFTRQGTDSPARQVFTEQAGTGSATLQPLSDSEAYAVIVGRHGAHLERTSDGGVTTVIVSALPRGLAHRYFRLVMVTHRVGYLITDRNEIEGTHDAGRHWAPLDPPPDASED